MSGIPCVPPRSSSSCAVEKLLAAKHFQISMCDRALCMSMRRICEQLAVIVWNRLAHEGRELTSRLFSIINGYRGC